MIIEFETNYGKYQRLINLPWHEWFAWRPIRIKRFEATYWVWLRKVMRKRNHVRKQSFFGLGNKTIYKLYWEYKIIQGNR